MPGATAAVVRLEAPGAPRYHGDMRAPEPGPAAWPRVSDYAVEPESGQELFDGEVREALPAGPKHGDQHNQVDYVLRAYIAPGYGASTDLLTRQAVPHNFASDTSIRKKGTDPETGDRYLEELAFEIKSTQSAEDLEQRARIMVARGVRRIFAIPVRGDAAGSEIIAGPVAEWMATEERWRMYRDDEVIADPCLFQRLPVRALLDAVEADDAVAQALLGKGNRVIIKYGDERYRAGEEKGRKDGEEKGRKDGEEKGRKDGEENAARKYIHLLMSARGVVIDAEADARIAECSDRAVLDRWVVRAAQVTSASELFGDD
jgi:hypothetical protein